MSEPGYTPWVPRNSTSQDPVLADSITISGVKIRFKKMGEFGTHLATNWFKDAALGAAKLVSDGIYVADGNNGAQIEMRISGLPAGNHSILIYLNATDNPANNVFSPINIYLDEELVAEKLIPSARASNSAAAFHYIDVTVEEGKDIVLLFAADVTFTGDGALRENGTPKTVVKNVMINGVEINTGNISKQSSTPVPSNGDEHVELMNINGSGNNGVQLSWTPAEGTLSHDVYFGTNRDAVLNADHGSTALFKGNITSPTIFIPDLYSMDTYYWRVDEVSVSGTVKGNVWNFRPGQLAFPSAEGFGRFARGGRGGKVVEVTNLNDSGPGSLREAVTNDIGPRTIVFTVSGVIDLQSRLVLSNRYVTIAGQTAPGKGICIRKSPFGIGANDAVIRYIRLRLGAGPTADGMGLGGDYSIMDHCSISWTIDEAFSSRGARNITLQRTLISEALNAAGHQNYPAGTEHGYAATIGGNKGSFHHNLLAHNYGRNWSLGGGLVGASYGGRLDIRNNVVYNWGSRSTDGGAHEVNFVNNYYKPGAGTTKFVAFTLDHEGVGEGTQRCYFTGNVMPGRFDESNQEDGRIARYHNNVTKTYETFVSQPFFDAPVTTQTALHAYKMVLSDVGANQPFFDNHDTRMINETLMGTYRTVGSVTNKKGFPDHHNDSGGYETYTEVHRAENWDSDHDGLPDWWENIHGLNPNSAPGDFSDSNADTDRDGFTQLDNYLQWMAEPHFFSIGGEPVRIDLKELAKGFSSSPSFVLLNVTNGTTSLNNGVLDFSITGNGLASFEFTVTDSDGHSMTRKVNLVGGVRLPLPVTMTELKAVRKNNVEVKLDWKTVQESNNSHFEVLRSDNASDFRNLGVKINSKARNGNSTTPILYDFIDHNNNVNDTYYQLVQKDRDGQTAYSEIKVVKGNDTEFNIWPNPSKGDVFLSVGELKESAKLYVYDILGKQISSRELVPNQIEKIFISNKGVYVFKIKGVKKDKDLFTQKIVIE